MANNEGMKHQNNSEVRYFHKEDGVVRENLLHKESSEITAPMERAQPLRTYENGI